MSKKNLVQVFIAVACLIGAFMVLYNNGVFGGQQLPGVTFSHQSGTASKSAGIFGADAILPFGKLQESDFDKAFGSRKTGMLKTTYPKLDPNKDVKIEVKDLFVGLSTSTPAQ